MSVEGNFLVQGEDPLLSQSATDKTVQEVVISPEGDEEKVPVKYQVNIVQRNGIDTQVWVCGLCNREFKYQYALFRHFACHTEGRSFQCSVCSKTFRHLATLHQHKAIHSQDRPFSCTECSKSFNRMSTLISHKKTHSAEKPFKCPVCQHGFHQKGNLRNHVYIHTNERPYRCPYCDRGFNQMSNLACHKMKAHAQEVGITFQCHTCDLRFAKKSLLKAHNQEHHKEAKGKATAKKSTKTSPKSSTMLKLPFEKSIAIPLVDTEAMRKAKAKGETPFGLLHTQDRLSVLVRIYDFGDGSMICEVKREDLGAFQKIPIVAVIEEKGGEYVVNVPTKEFTHEMSIREDGRIFFIKKEAEPEGGGSGNAFFGSAEGREDEEEGSTAGSHLANTSFNTLMDAIKSEGFSPDVPNILKFFAGSPDSSQTSRCEKEFQEL